MRIDAQIILLRFPSRSHRFKIHRVHHAYILISRVVIIGRKVEEREIQPYCVRDRSIIFPRIKKTDLLHRFRGSPSMQKKKKKYVIRACLPTSNGTLQVPKMRLLEPIYIYVYR